MKQALKQQRGFSIIELAVTMVVLGILMTSAMPNITSWLRNIKLRNQSESLLAGLQQARNEAVHRNRTATLWLINLPTASRMDDNCALSSTGTSWVVTLGTASPTGKCGTTPSSDTAPFITTSRVGADGSAGVSVKGLLADGETAASSVTFDGFGRATAGSAQAIDVNFATPDTQNDHPLRIEISSSGLTRLCDTTVSVTGDPRKCTQTTGSSFH